MLSKLDSLYAMPNRLASATSPYLLQHADNPVNWYEWGTEALSLAEDRDVPIFLSVGYSACHWCHVMAHESFENPTTASYMNDNFINIKVDKEERPDIDRIYMDAVQSMTGQGGWPMSVFLTPNGRPILAGTYFPLNDHPQRPSFRRVMEAVIHAWSSRRDEVNEQADRLLSIVRGLLPPLADPPERQVIDQGINSLIANFDNLYGGFGGAPKFPQAPNLELLLRSLAVDPEGPKNFQIRNVLNVTLDRMAAGGIYDHLGGGFARYSVDRMWLVPHFEKMLYDNALLARIYLRAWQLLGRDGYRKVAIETLNYLIRDMIDATGAVHSAEDADSEGKEGKFYIWDEAEFSELLGEESTLLTALYGVTPNGNFEGSNILHIATDPEQIARDAGISLQEFQEIRTASDRILMQARGSRIKPEKDDKVIAAWNGLALRAFAEAGAVLGNRQYLNAAKKIAAFCLEELTTTQGRLLRSARNGRHSGPAFCDDYGALATGLLVLYQATGDSQWFDAGRMLADDMIDLFVDEKAPGFFATGRDAEQLIVRPKNYMDNPVPSDNSLAAETLQMMYALTGETVYRSHLNSIFLAAGRLMEKHPAAIGHLLAVLAVDQPTELAIVGPASHRKLMEDVVWETFRPDVVLASGQGESDSRPPILTGRDPGTTARAYVCEEFVCLIHVDNPESLRCQLS